MAPSLAHPPAVTHNYARASMPEASRPAARAWERAVELTNRVGDRALKLVNRAIARQSKLPVQPFYRPSDFAWVAPVEANWKAIRAELDAVLAHRDALPNFQDISTDQYTLTDDDRWKTYFFYGYGFRSDANCARCPETTRLIEAIPGMETAMFSILAPGKRIPPHTGPYKGVLRYHLGLVVPDAPVEQVGIRVGGETAGWSEGASLVFDDSYEHEAWNHADADRIVLIVDLWHIGLEPIEIHRLAGLQRYAAAYAGRLGRYWSVNEAARQGPARLGPDH
jgi:beta-hydroxylase